MVFTMQWHNYIQQVKEHQRPFQHFKECIQAILVTSVAAKFTLVPLLPKGTPGSGTTGATTSQAHAFTMLSQPTVGKKTLPAQSALQ